MNVGFLVVISFCIILCNGYNVLFIAPFSGRSHHMYMSSFVKALLDRGHDVTFLTSNSLSHSNLANYTEVLIDPPLDLAKHLPQEEIVEIGSSSVFSSINQKKNFPMVINKYVYDNPNVQRFIKSTGLHFDVIVAEEFFADSFSFFSFKHKVPVVTICAFGATHFIDRQQGLLSPPSIVPHWMLPYSDDMSFVQRLHNTIVVFYDWFVRSFVFIPAEEALANKYFAHLAPLPRLNDIINNVSVVLVNTHRAISPPRPSMPNVIPIGGAHINPVKPLPEDLKEFLDGAKDGAIYFSLGSFLRSSKLPKETIQGILDSFKDLKQRVLWKFEDESRSDIPSNVMIRKWMPQNDILAHPNVVLFFSHGGMFGSTESLYHGVPLLVIPFFGDQHRNAYRIAAAGYGKFMDHRDISKETLTKAITEIVSDDTYLEKAKLTLAVFKDNVVHPMDEAMFWIEHVAKFKGAKHLKSHAVQMSWFTYLMLLFSLLLDIVVFLIIRTLPKKLLRRKNTSIVAEKKQK